MKVVVVGGAGFIGSNLAEHFLDEGDEVVVFDSLFRPGGGAKRNLEVLKARYGECGRFTFFHGDVRSFRQVRNAVAGADLILHVAAQTALMESIRDPLVDFEINARGTVNVLEAARTLDDPVVIYASSTAVYGDLTAVPVSVREGEKRWVIDDPLFEEGTAEVYPVVGGGPYGCSKAAGDLYCLDYARTFGLRTVVLRFSAMYGPYQRGVEDQGWVAWFMQRAIQRKPVTIFGDGKQVRDILFVSDVIDAVEACVSNVRLAAGNAYNIGGGKAYSLSLLEMIDFMRSELGIAPSYVYFDEWRPVDCLVQYVDTAKAKSHLGWQPKVAPEEGLRKTYQWLEDAL